MIKCRSCGAEIKFIRMKSGRWNPVDPARRGIKKDGGNEVLITEDGELIQGTFASVEEGANGFGYVSHFATCPNAYEHRKRGNNDAKR
jgi:hypothetical protein